MLNFERKKNHFESNSFENNYFDLGDGRKNSQITLIRSMWKGEHVFVLTTSEYILFIGDLLYMYETTHYHGF